MPTNRSNRVTSEMLLKILQSWMSILIDANAALFKEFSTPPKFRFALEMNPPSSAYLMMGRFFLSR